MPFAQWYAHMREDGISPMGRYLGMCVAMFKTFSNAELELLTGVEGTTFKKYKQELKKAGYIIIGREERGKGGRSVGFEPLPAHNETLVEFTDLLARKEGKYYLGNEDSDTRVISNQVSKNTRVISDQVSPHTPLKDNKPITVSTQSLTTTTTDSSDAARGGGGFDFEILNGTAVDLTAFIAKHNLVDEKVAREMLATNVRIYGAQPVMEAFAITVAEMAGGLVPKPYRYLIGTAAKLRDGQAVKQQRGAARPGRKTMSEIIREEAEKMQQQEDRGKS